MTNALLIIRTENPMLTMIKSMRREPKEAKAKVDPNRPIQDPDPNQKAPQDVIKLRNPLINTEMELKQGETLLIKAAPRRERDIIEDPSPNQDLNLIQNLDLTPNIATINLLQ